MFQQLVKKNIQMLWLDPKFKRESVSLTKVDFCVDLTGSFIPTDSSSAFEKMKHLLQEVIHESGAVPGLSKYDGMSLSDLKINKGGNNLQTCYQYSVMNALSIKVLTVKFYSKTLDLIGRDGC